MLQVAEGQVENSQFEDAKRLLFTIEVSRQNFAYYVLTARVALGLGQFDQAESALLKTQPLAGSQVIKSWQFYLYRALLTVARFESGSDVTVDALSQAIANFKSVLWEQPQQLHALIGLSKA